MDRTCTECGGEPHAHATTCRLAGRPRRPNGYRTVNGVVIPTWLDDEAEPELNPIEDLTRAAFDGGA